MNSETGIRGFCQSGKGFFDMGDFSFLYQPDWGLYETVETPEMTRFMYFKHTHRHGKMMRFTILMLRKPGIYFTKQ